GRSQLAHRDAALDVAVAASRAVDAAPGAALEVDRDDAAAVARVAQIERGARVGGDAELRLAELARPATGLSRQLDRVRLARAGRKAQALGRQTGIRIERAQELKGASEPARVALVAQIGRLERQRSRVVGRRGRRRGLALAPHDLGAAALAR